MAFKRHRSFVKGRRFKRRRLMRRKAPYGGFIRSAAWAAKQIWKLKGLVNSEMFKKDITWSPAAITQGDCILMSGVTQGDGDGQRTGNSIFVRALNVKGIFTHNATGQNNQTIRVSLVMDTQQIGDTAPSYTTIYESASPYAHLNSDTVGRFKVLFTRTLTVNNYDKNSQLFTMNIPMRHHVRYNGTASTDIQRGGLYLCWSCDEVGAAGTFPTFAGESRLSYHDN